VNSSFLLTAAAVAVISWTLSSERLFQAPRQWVAKRSKLLALGVACPFCVGGWVAVPALSLVSPETIPAIISTYFVLVGASGVLTTLYGTARQLLKLATSRATIAALEAATLTARAKRLEKLQRRNVLPTSTSDDATHVDRIASLARV